MTKGFVSLEAALKAAKPNQRVVSFFERYYLAPKRAKFFSVSVCADRGPIIAHHRFLLEEDNETRPGRHQVRRMSSQVEDPRREK